MATRKITITLPDDAVEQVTALARAEGLPLSTYLTRLAQHRIRVEAGLAAMREWDQEQGPVPDEAYAWAEEQIARAEASMRRPTRAAG